MIVSPFSYDYILLGFADGSHRPRAELVAARIVKLVWGNGKYGRAWGLGSQAQQESSIGEGMGKEYKRRLKIGVEKERA